MVTVYMQVRPEQEWNLYALRNFLHILTWGGREEGVYQKAVMFAKMAIHPILVYIKVDQIEFIFFCQRKLLNHHRNFSTIDENF